MKIKRKIGIIKNCFKITPCIQITYSPYLTGFAIEFTWGKWGIAWKFDEYNNIRQFIDLGAYIYFKL